jgi:flagellar hook assembly protein FlgD
MNPGGVLTVMTSQLGAVRVRLYDTAGRLVRTLLDSPSLPAGYHDVPVDGRTDRGTPLPSGAYFFRVEAAEGSRTGRIAIVR